MTIALLHPGDLPLWTLLLALFVIIVVPALVLGALLFAVYKMLSAKRGEVKTIKLEENRGPNAASGDGTDRT